MLESTSVCTLHVSESDAKKRRLATLLGVPQMGTHGSEAGRQDLEEHGTNTHGSEAERIKALGADNTQQYLFVCFGTRFSRDLDIISALIPCDVGADLQLSLIVTPNPEFPQPRIHKECACMLRRVDDYNNSWQHEQGRGKAWSAVQRYVRTAAYIWY